MKIETKFDEGDYVLIIHDSDILRREIVGVRFLGREVSYSILLSKALTSMDKDVHVVVDESNCFLSLGELYNFYLEKLKPKP